MNRRIILINFLIIVLVPILLGICMLFNEHADFEDAATFGSETTVLFANTDINYFHCQDSRDLDKCIKNKKNIYLWLGNSQLHSINQYKNNDKTAPSILHSLLDKKNIQLITISQPNSNLKEQLILLQYLVQNNIRINKLILPIVFDDLRENDIRQSISVYLESAQLSNQFNVNQTDINLVKKISSNKNKNLDGLQNSNQFFIEDYLNHNLENISAIWSNRGDYRSSIFTFLYKTRNLIFNIKPTSQRKIIKSAYNENLYALNNILKICEQYKISPIIYIAPIRNDITLPYNLNEYEQFKNEIYTLTESYNLRLHDLDNLIPSQYWGDKDSTNLNTKIEIDFMHFSGVGHIILANKIFNLINQ